jgi:hypothetical protein
MADPVTLTALGVSAATTIAGGVAGAAGASYKSQAEANMYNYQAGVAKANAQIAKQDATYALASGQVEAEQSGMRTAAEVGATRVGYAAGNISGGSPNKVIASEKEIGAQQSGIIQANAAKRAYGFEVGAAGDVAQAGAFESAAETSRVAGDVAVTSSILGTVGSVSSKWLQAKNAFGGGTPGATGGTDPTYSNYGFGYT